MHVSGLTYPVTAVLSLSVHGGVPVTVVEHYSVSSGQIHSHASGPRRQDEAEDSLVCVESLHQHLSHKQHILHRTDLTVEVTKTLILLPNL